MMVTPALDAASPHLNERPIIVVQEREGTDGISVLRPVLRWHQPIFIAAKVHGPNKCTLFASLLQKVKWFGFFGISAG
jgi:hypothetical protein